MEENVKSKNFLIPLKRTFTSSGALKTYSSIICILVSLLIGLIVLLCMSPEDALYEFFVMLTGGIEYFKSEGVAAILAKTAPLLCCGLAIVFANKTGMFNIGVAGQYTIGVFASLMFALQFKLPWYVCILAAMVLGAIWATIPGLLKAYCNVNEVISGIMLNWIALFFTNYSFQTYLNDCVDITKGSKTYVISQINPSGALPKIGDSSYLTIAVIFAFIAALIVWFIMAKTTLGYQLKASGLNKDATRFAGMKEKRNIIVSMAISGALAGLGASLYYLAGLEEWSVQLSNSLPSVPWNGIVVAFVGQLSPIGTIFSSLFVSTISHGSIAMTQTIFPAEIADLVTGVIVYLSGLTNLVVILLNKYVFKRKKKEKLVVVNENKGEE